MGKISAIRGETSTNQYSVWICIFLISVVLLLICTSFKFQNITLFSIRKIGHVNFK